MRKYIITLAAILTALSGLARAATQADYYVDPNMGLDSNSGSLESPFQTLEKARDTVRTVNSNMTGDIVVYLRGGTYSLDQALTLDAQDSGNNGFQVIYRNYPDEAPIIDGGKPISGWTAVSNGIYSASADSMIFNQLVVNNQPAQRARHPEYGSPYKIIANNDAAQKIRINLNEIEQWSNLNRVQMVIASSFTSCRLRIDSFVTNTLDEAVVTPMDPERAAYWGWLSGPLDGTPSYYFENHFDFLDTPGEWFLDVDTDTVYYMPRADEDMSTATVAAPELEELLHVDGAENLTLFGLTFQQAAWLEPMTKGMVQRQGSMRVLATDNGTNGWSTAQFNVLPAATYFKGIKNVRIERCVFTKMGAAAMGFDTGTSNNIVVGNVFSEIAESAIIYDMDNYRWATGDQLSSLDTFDSNYFFRIGTLYYGGTGLFAFWPDRISITHNEFSQINGLGMNVGWGATYDTTATKEPLVAYNRIHDTAVRVLDSGGLHTKSDMSGAVIKQNWFYNITKRSWWDIGPSNRHSHGIYLDDNSENSTISSNVFININDTDIKVKGFNHTRIDNDSQDQNIKDESGIRSGYTDIKEFWRGGAIGRDLEPSEAYTNALVELATLYDEPFDAEMVGEQPPGFTCNTSGGTIEIINIPGSGNRSVRMTDNDAWNSGAVLSKSIGTQSGVVSSEFRIKAGQTDNSLFFNLLDASGKKACHIGFAGNGSLRYYYQSGEYTDIDTYSVGTWYTFRIEADVVKQTFSMWINDALVLGDSMFFTPTDNLTTLQLYNTFQTGFFDLDYVTVEGRPVLSGPFTANAHSVRTLPDTPVDIILDGSHPKGSNLTFNVATLPIHGTLSTNGALPNLIYTPTNGYTGADHFTFTASDGTTNSALATVSITVETNWVPFADAQGVSTFQNTPVNITLTGRDPDRGPDDLTYIVVDAPTHGALSGTAPNLIYTPANGYAGVDSFTFVLNDGATNSAPAAVSITMETNLGPVADAQSVSTFLNTAVGITLTGSDPDDGPGLLTYSLVSQPTNGVLSGTSPNLIYTPTNGYTGADSFTFIVNDGLIDSAPATVAIEVQEIVYQDNFDNDGLGVNVNGVGGGAINRTIASHSWTDDGSLRFSPSGTAFSLRAAAYAANAFQSDNGFELTVYYTSGSVNNLGRNLFSFGLVSDDTDMGAYSGTNPFTEANSIYGIGVNVQQHTTSAQSRGLWFANGSTQSLLDLSGTSQQFIANSSTPVVIRVVANGSGGADWSYSINGVAEASGTIGTFDFTKSYRFVAYGQDDQTSRSIQSVTLLGIADLPPVADAQRVDTLKDIPVDITLVGCDPEGNSVTYSLASQPAHGTLTTNGALPNLTYTPDSGYSGTDSFTFTVNDGLNNSAPATVSISISSVATDILAGYDFDDGTSNATQAVTFNDIVVTASDYTVGAGLSNVVNSSNGNSNYSELDAEGNVFGTANGFEFGSAQGVFGFTDMNNQNNLALAITHNDYMTFTVTPTHGVGLDLSRLTFRTRVNQLINSAERWALFSSVDGFAETNAIAIGRTGVISTYVNNVVDLSEAKFQGLTNVTFRLYIFGGSDIGSSATLFDKVILHGSATSASNYASWVAGYGLTGTNALADADGENGGIGDGYDNLAEYALGMNPTNSDAGSRDWNSVATEGGTNWFEYVHFRRADYAEQDLSYLLIDSTNLLDSVAFTNAQDQIYVGPAVDGYEPVTNRYSTDEPVKFIELQIQQD